jgi:hypothetical protein
MTLAEFLQQVLAQYQAGLKLGFILTQISGDPRTVDPDFVFSIELATFTTIEA